MIFINLPCLWASEWGDKHLACVAKLTGLGILDINLIRATDGCINDLNKLTMLVDLTLRNTQISGKALWQSSNARRSYGRLHVFHNYNIMLGLF